MRTRSIGMEAAIIAVAGSAVPKMSRSTVVALRESLVSRCLDSEPTRDASCLSAEKGGLSKVLLTVAVPDHIHSSDLHEGHDTIAVLKSVTANGDRWSLPVL